VTWRSVPGGCPRRARPVLTVVPVGPGLCWLFCLSGRTWTLLARPVPVGPGCCWLFLFRSDLDAAGSFCSGRRKKDERKRDGRGSLTAGRNGSGKKEKAGRPGFPRNGREGARKKREKAGKPGFPRDGRERARKTEKAGRPGFPRNGRERVRKKGEGGLSARSEAESESVLELG
jgi:hypothetical protein